MCTNVGIMIFWLFSFDFNKKASLREFIIKANNIIQYLPMKSASLTSNRLTAFVFAMSAGGFVFLLHAYLVHSFGVNAPFFDEWVNLQFFDKYTSNALTLTDIFSLHNEHQIVIARLAFFGLYSFYGEWNLLSEMLFSASILALYTSISVYTFHRLGFTPVISIIATIILASTLQWQNIIWGFQIQFYTMLFGNIVGICLVTLSHRITWNLVLMLIFCCLISTYSIASGLFSWAIIGSNLIFKLMLEGVSFRSFLKNRSLIVKAGLFALLLIVCSVNYLRLYIPSYSVSTPSTQYKAHTIFQGIMWFIRVLCYPLLDQSNVLSLCLSIGFWLTIVMATTIMFVRRSNQFYKNRLVLFFGLLSLIGINGATLAYSRGAIPGVEPRYATIFLWNSILFLLAFDTIICVNIKARLWLKPILLILCCITFSGVLFSHAIGYETSISTMRTFSENLLRQTGVATAFLRNTSPERQLGENSSAPSREVVQTWLSNPTYIRHLPPSMLSASTQIKSSLFGTGWTTNGVYPSPSALEIESWGSWSSADSSTGTIDTEPIVISKPLLVIPVMGYPGMANQRLVIEAVNSPDNWFVFNSYTPKEQWYYWTVDVSQYIGQSVRIIGIDSGSSLNAWHGFGTPYQMSRQVWAMNWFLENTKTLFFVFLSILTSIWILVMAKSSLLTSISIQKLLFGVIVFVCISIFIITVHTPGQKTASLAANHISLKNTPYNLLSVIPRSFIPTNNRRLLDDGVFLHPDDALDFGPFVTSEKFCFVSDAIIDAHAQDDPVSDGVTFVAQIWNSIIVQQEAKVVVTKDKSGKFELQLPTNIPFSLRLATEQRANGQYDWAIWHNPRIDRCSS